MIHIGTVMRVLGERKTFIGNHPDFLSFILQVFGGELALVELRASDMDFFQGMRQLVKEIVKE